MTDQQKQQLDEMIESLDERKSDRAAAKHVAPKVGDAATYRVWTDHHACTVIAVSKSGVMVTLQRDKATLLNGFNSGEPDALTSTPAGFAHIVNGVQRYAYERDPEGEIIKVSYRAKFGTWKAVGHRATSPGGSATFGSRREYHDYGF